MRFLDLLFCLMKSLGRNAFLVGIALLSWASPVAADVCGDAAERAVIAAGFSHAARPSWQRRVRASALLPTMRARASYQQGGGQYWPSGDALQDWSYRAGHQVQVAIDLQWELTNLAWHRDELALSREILRAREKRADLVAEILQLCLEHERLRAELAATSREQRAPLEQARLRLLAQLIARGAFDRSGDP